MNSCYDVKMKPTHLFLAILFIFTVSSTIDCFPKTNAAGLSFKWKADVNYTFKLYSSMSTLNATNHITTALTTASVEHNMLQNHFSVKPAASYQVESFFRTTTTTTTTSCWESSTKESNLSTRAINSFSNATVNKNTFPEGYGEDGTANNTVAQHYPRCNSDNVGIKRTAHERWVCFYLTVSINIKKRKFKVKRKCELCEQLISGRCRCVFTCM